METLRCLKGCTRTILSRSRLLLPGLILGTLLTTGCAELNDPYYSPRDDYYDRGRYNDDYHHHRGSDWDRSHYERREIERERDRLEAERRRLEAERARDSHRYDPPPPPRRSEDRCPSGFHPSEQKCSPDERRHGCQDIRLPSGLGCVKR